jgi:hypothetical protein
MSSKIRRAPPKKGKGKQKRVMASKAQRLRSTGGIVDPAHNTSRDALTEVQKYLNGRGLKLFQAPVPDYLLVQFRWTSPVVSMSNAAAFVSLQWNLNNLHTVDGTNAAAMVGLSEWTAFFSLYRVLEATVKASVINGQSVPTNVVMLPFTYLGGEGSNYASTSLLFGSPYSQQVELSPLTGLDRHVFHARYNLSQILGAEEYYTDDNYAAALGSSPARQLFLFLGAWMTGSNPTSLYFNLEIMFTAHLYNRTTETSLVDYVAKKKAALSLIPIVLLKKAIIETLSSTTNTSSTECDCDESFMDYTEY